MKDKTFEISFKESLFILAVFLVSFLARILYLNQIAKNSPFFLLDGSTMDPAMYSDWALSIASGNIIGKEIFSALPLYPYFLGVLYFLFDSSIYIARLMQFFMGSVSVVLIYLIAKAAFGARAGVFSAILAAFYAPFIFYEGIFVPASLIVFLFCASCLTLMYIMDSSKVSAWFLCGILFGLSALASPSALLAAFFISVLIFKRKNMPRAANLKTILAFCFAVCLVIGAVTARNYIVGKDLVLITSHGGVNFYIGNNPKATGRFQSIGQSVEGATDLIEDTRILAEESSGKILKPSQIQSFWTKKAMGFIYADPKGFLRLLCRKFCLFWSGFEYPDVEEYYFSKRFSPLLRWPLFAFWFIGPLGITGALLCVRKFNKAGSVYIFLLSVTAGVIVFFVNSRYRVPAAAFLIAFAGFSISYLWDAVRGKKPKMLCAFLAIFLISFLFVNSSTRKPDYVTAYYNLSAIFLNRGVYSRAEEYAQKSLELSGDSVMPRFILGQSFLRQNRFDEAIEEFKKTTVLMPDFSLGYAGLGEVYFAKSMYNESCDYLNRAVALDPHDFATRIQLGNCYVRLDKLELARNEFGRALKLRPDDTRAKERLDKLLSKRSDKDE